MLSHIGMEKIIPGGFGVTIFFFLSGYLITSLLRSELTNSGTISLQGFYIRRTLRIIPPLFITLTFAVLLIEMNVIQIPITAFNIFLQYFFLSNYAYFFSPEIHEAPIPLWSLAVEEHFYLAFPLLYRILGPRLGNTRFAFLCAVMSAAVLIVRFLVMRGNVVPFYEIYMPTHTRIDSILFGCILALWNNPILDAPTAWKPKTWHFITAIGVLIFCLIFRSEYFRQTLRYTVQGMSLFVVFSYALSNRGLTSRILGSRIAHIIGSYSYTLYLCHVIFIDCFEQHMPSTNLYLRGFLAFVLSFVFAAIMFELVEKRLARMRKRLHVTDAEATSTTV